MPVRFDPEARPRLIDLGIVGLTVLALALGGATDSLVQVALLFAGACLLLADPQAFRIKSLSPLWFALPGLWSFTAFLPGSWFSEGFGGILRAHLDGPFPATLSPQPWLTLERILFYGAQLGWACYLLNRRWSTPPSRLIEGLAISVAGIALVAVVAKMANALPPTWHPVNGFGFFPNRNHTGNALGLAAIILFALGLTAKTARRVAVWFGAGVVVVVALVFNGSRAGLFIAFAGSVTWLVFSVLTRQVKRETAVRAGSMLAAGLLLVFCFAAPLISRFLELASASLADDFRLRIQQDLWPLIKLSPVAGIGLGNFEGAFALFRRESLLPKHVVHPESDWLWQASETGFVGVLALLPLIVLALRNVWTGTDDRPLRVAVLVAGFAFLLHGFIDVSGHRMGTVWFVLLLVAILQSPRISVVPSPAFIWPARFAAIAGAAALLAWLNGLIPGTPRLRSHERQLAGSTIAENPTLARDAVAHALKIAPLDWRWHFYAGLTASDAGHSVAAFHRANLLAAGSVEVPLQVYEFWRSRNSQQAWLALAEVLRRADFAPAMVDQLANLSRLDPGAMQALWTLNLSRPENQLILLRKTPEPQRSQFIQGLAESESLTAGWSWTQRRELYEIWEQSKWSPALPEFLSRHSVQMGAAWQALARLYVRTKQHSRAVELIQAWQPVPSFVAQGAARPSPASAEGLVAGLNEWLALSKARDDRAALLVAERLVREHPALEQLNYLVFKSASVLGRAEAACGAWSKFSAVPP